MAEHVTGQFIIQIVFASCWIEGPLLPTVSIMLEDIPDWNVSVGQVLKGQPSLHLIKDDKGDVCCTDMVHFLILSGGGGGNSVIDNKGLQAVLEGMGSLFAEEGAANKCHFCLYITWFFVSFI